MFKKVLQTQLILSCATLMVMASHSANSAANLDESLNQTVGNATIEQGKILYEQICATCHAKDLSGGVGFNLKDGEWIHGNQPSDILNSIKNGFSKAGMPAFGAMFKEDQLAALVDYVLSKREGFDGLTYKIYQMNNPSDTDVTQGKLVKSGQAFDNLADFRLPEIDQYIIEFEGDFYAPTEFDTRIWVQWGKVLDINIYSDGELLMRQEPQWYPTWKLKRGKQRLKIIYRVGDNKLNQRNVSLIVTNDDRSIKLFPVSVRAKDILSDNKQVIKATNRTVIQRKKMLELPSYSIAVGLPNSINYAFNSKMCSVVALWRGDMLNVGPNVSGRGEDGSIAMGPWAFKFPQAVATAVTNFSCLFKGYTVDKKGDPTFSYQQNGVDFTVLAKTDNAEQITFHYQVKTSDPTDITINLPIVDSIVWRLGSEIVNRESVDITPYPKGEFILSATFNN